MFYPLIMVKQFLLTVFHSIDSYIVISTSISYSFHSYPSRFYTSFIPYHTKCQIHCHPHYLLFNDLNTTNTIPIPTLTHFYHLLLSLTSTHHHSHLNCHYVHASLSIIYHSTQYLFISFPHFCVL